MAVTLTVADLARAARVGDTAIETAELTRILAYVTEAIDRHLGDAYDTTPDAVINEAAVRMGAYIFDRPTASRGAAYANAGRNSGAWSALLPWTVHRAGSAAEAVAAAPQAPRPDETA